LTHLNEVQIDVAALDHNLAALRALTPPDMRVAAVVKGNAYGHGLGEVVSALQGEVEAFQVDDVEELRALRRHTDAPALVLGYVSRQEVEEAVALGGELAIYDAERLLDIEEAGRRLNCRPRVHLKVDALLGRQGVTPADLDGFLGKLTGREIEVVAAYAHFANIEDTTDLGHALAQIEVFDAAYERIRAVFPQAGRHLSATSGLMTVEPARND